MLTAPLLSPSRERHERDPRWRTNSRTSNHRMIKTSFGRFFRGKYVQIKTPPKEERSWYNSMPPRTDLCRKTSINNGHSSFGIAGLDFTQPTPHSHRHSHTDSGCSVVDKVTKILGLPYTAFGDTMTSVSMWGKITKCRVVVCIKDILSTKYLSWHKHLD